MSQTILCLSVLESILLIITFIEIYYHYVYIPNMRHMTMEEL